MHKIHVIFWKQCFKTLKIYTFRSDVFPLRFLCHGRKLKWHKTRHFLSALMFKKEVLWALMFLKVDHICLLGTDKKCVFFLEIAFFDSSPHNRILEFGCGMSTSRLLTKWAKSVKDPLNKSKGSKKSLDCKVGFGCFSSQTLTCHCAQTKSTDLAFLVSRSQVA